MDQISPPFRIALVAMLAMCAVWFTVLKPKDPAAEPATPAAPGTTGLANDVSAAKGAVGASNDANARTQAATGSATATTPATTAAKPAGTPRSAAAAKKAASADATAPLLRALDRKQAVVLLFWNKRGIADKAVRRAVAGAADRHGRVVVKTVPVGQVGRYAAITREAKVAESPTVLVIAPNRTVRPVVGFTTKAELDQLVGDALAAKRAKK